MLFENLCYEAGAVACSSVYGTVSHARLACKRTRINCVLVFQPHEDISSYQLKFCAIIHLLQFTAEESSVRNQVNQPSHSVLTSAKH